MLRTPNVIKQSPALASPHTDLPFTCRDVKRRHQTPRGGRVFAQQIRQGRERWFGESQYESARASYTNEIDAVTLDSFGYLNREEVRHENGPPGGKSVPNPVWDRWIGHANHS